MRAAVSMLVLAACATSPASDDGAYTVIAISSPVAFDELDVVRVFGAKTYVAIATPQLLASGEAPVVLPDYARGPSVHDETVSRAATTHATYNTWDIGETFGAAFVIARSGGSPVGAGFTQLTFVYRDGAYHADASLAIDTTAEVWGIHDNCTRVDNRYLSDAADGETDTDCDGWLDSGDCKPDAYCDPSATDPASVAACQCP